MNLDALEVLGEGGVRVHVVHARPDDADAAARPPALFVHGYPDTHTTWSHQLAALAPSRPVAALDLPGAGASASPDRPGGLRLAALLADLDAVVDAIAGSKGQVHLIGHDWGGAIAWHYAADPRRAARLRSITALAGPHPAMMVERLARGLRSRRRAELAFVADQLRRSWYILAFQIPGLAEAIWRRWPEALWRRAHRAGGVPHGDPELAPGRDAILRPAISLLGLYRDNFSLTPRPAPDVSVPACLIVPTRDFALAPALYDNVADHVPDLEVHAVDANHWAHRSDPARINAILADFIARHDLP